MADDQARASAYDDPMSERLLGIAADVLRSFGSAFGGRHLAIVGGAVPGLLVPTLPRGMEPHVGTADLDLHLSLHLLDGETASGGLTYEFPVAGLTSWLCLKSDAIMRRDKPKDDYDVVWVLDALGPDAASDMVTASPLLAGPFAEEVRGQLRLLIDDQFRDEASVGPTAYATFLEADPAESAHRHALGTVAAFGRVLTARGIEL